MQIDKDKLLASAAKLGITDTKAEELWNALSSNGSSPPAEKFELSHLLYYFGIAIVMVAMGRFANMAWTHFGGLGLLATSLAYIAIFFAVGCYLWQKKALKVPGGLFLTMAVCTVPFAVYGLQMWTGWHGFQNTGSFDVFFISWFKVNGFFIEAATILAGCLVLKYFRFPFLTAPIFFALWSMSMDFPLLFGNYGDANWLSDARLWTSMAFGVLMMFGAYVTDLQSKRDFAFWGYLFGLLAFWPAFSAYVGVDRFDSFIYLLVNVVLLLLSVALQRTVFLFFGSLGVLIYMTTIYGKYLSGLWFPAILSLTGILIVAAGILYQKNREKIDLFILKLFPKSIQQWLPRPKK